RRYNRRLHLHRPCTSRARSFPLPRNRSPDIALLLGDERGERVLCVPAAYANLRFVCGLLKHLSGLLWTGGALEQVKERLAGFLMVRTGLCRPCIQEMMG